MTGTRKYPLFHPQFWPAWLGLGLLWLIIHLPESSQLAIGRNLGRLLYLCGGKLKKITLTNLRLCFPGQTPEERLMLARRNFSALGIGLIEAARAFWLPSEKLLASCTLHGFEHIPPAFAKGKGILLVSPHFTCLEIVGRLLALQHNFSVMFRPHKKPVLAFIHERFRNRHYPESIPSHRIRRLIEALKNNRAVWYAYDIDGGKKNSVFAPFFGIEAASLTSVSRLAHMSGAAVVPVHFYRQDKGFRYDVFLGPSLTHFPSDSLIKDATRLNALMEKAIRQKPEQYIWQYQRFKTRPNGQPRLYSQTAGPANDGIY